MDGMAYIFGPADRTSGGTVAFRNAPPLPSVLGFFVIIFGNRNMFDTVVSMLRLSQQVVKVHRTSSPYGLTVRSATPCVAIASYYKSNPGLTA